MSERRTSSEWFELVESWKQSGTSAAGWCREHEIGYQNFLYWRRRLRDAMSIDRPLAVIPSETDFREILSRDELTAEINGVRLRLERGFDPALLREAIAAIRGA